ncbi:hypothetical protein FJT64_025202 [Amphibalanus amphitrite]|uniref:Uncharacterized protein n=1 Tax=Amphibalanus amphitrite TaxID=1232801 RepID=A0A6A4WC05_AMPAM|nr:hypothetical protein FJT64_025202 [Amphibalanus amphitrite]
MKEAPEEGILSSLWSLVRSVVCPLLWLAGATLDFLYQLAVCSVWLVVSAARALLALTLEAARVTGWLAYYAVRTPLSAVVQCAAALLWLVRLVVGGVHFFFLVAIPNILWDVWSIVGGAVHLVCVLVCMVGLAVCILLSVTCRSTALVVGLGCGLVKNVMALVSRVFGGAVLPGLV